MEYKPKPHQVLAAKFLQEHDKAALLLDMGLGKTVITLTRIEELTYQEFSVRATLVIAPKRVAEDTWTRECAKWDHLQKLRVSPILGGAAQRKAALQKEADLYVINRENVVWLIHELYGNWPFDCVVIDELSSFKSPQAKRWRALRKIIPKSRYVYGLTGTPAPKGYEDLWAEMYLLDQGQRLGRTLGAYRTSYFHPGAHKGHVVYEWLLNRGAKEQIDQRLSDLCLSMSKEDWLTLPPKISNRIVIRMSPAERKLYDTFEESRVLPLLDGEVSSLDEMTSAVVGSTQAVVTNKLLQMANGCVYDDAEGKFHVHDRKLDALEEIVDTNCGQPVLVFYAYRHDLDRLRARFPQAKDLKTAEDIGDWNAGKLPILLAHPASAGFGINLQEGGHIIVWFGLPWSLELYQQANARLYRQGQTQPVIINHLICAGTVDEHVLDVLQRKNATQQGLLDALKNYISGEEQDGENT